MKYLSPVKHLYRVAYADPKEHINRVQNLNMPFNITKASSKNYSFKEGSENQGSGTDAKHRKNMFNLNQSESMNTLFDSMLKQYRQKKQIIHS